MQQPQHDETERQLLADPTEFHVDFDYDTGYDYACCLTTTISALATCGLALLCYPCVSKLVRKEVDSQKCTVTENRVVLESGWLNRTTRYIPLDRIQDVNVQESIAHRHFGIKGVEIQTAGVGIGRMPEAYLLAPRDASTVRQVIMTRRDQLMFGRRRGGVNTAQDQPKDTKSPQLSGYDNAIVRELRELKESVLRIEAQIGESVTKMDAARESVKTLD